MKLKDFDFRIWDNTEKRYLNEIELHKYDKSPVEAGATFTETDRINEVEFVKNKNDLEIELFTGYYDYKGNKIYIGDIIECLVFTNEKIQKYFMKLFVLIWSWDCVLNYLMEMVGTYLTFVDIKIIKQLKMYMS
ncbi:hypothetical protein THJ041_02880 [Campylobacter jejuni]|nr:hypothetical protein THJ041_02880 [Campylobacter jejuni]